MNSHGSKSVGSFICCAPSCSAAPSPLNRTCHRPRAALLNHLVGTWILQGTIMPASKTTHDVQAAWVLNNESTCSCTKISREMNANGDGSVQKPLSTSITECEGATVHLSMAGFNSWGSLSPEGICPSEIKPEIYLYSFHLRLHSQLLIKYTRPSAMKRLPIPWQNG